MPKGLVVTGLTNKIEWATHNNRGLITGGREDVTENAIKAVMEHMNIAYERDAKAQEKGKYTYMIEGFGTLTFVPKMEKQ